jgi:hypothetical protein
MTDAKDDDFADIRARYQFAGGYQISREARTFHDDIQRLLAAIDERNKEIDRLTKATQETNDKLRREVAYLKQLKHSVACRGAIDGCECMA